MTLRPRTARSIDLEENVKPRPYVVILGSPTDPLLFETLNLLKTRDPAIAAHWVPDPLATNISVYTDWRGGWSIIDDREGFPLRLGEALAVLAMRLTSYGTDDDRFDDADNRYRRGETYAAWLALLSDPKIHVLNRPASRWPPVDVLGRFHLRAIARSSGVATIREVIGASVPAEATFRLSLPDGTLQRLDARTPVNDPARPFSYLFVDVPWQSLSVSRVLDEIRVDESSTDNLTHVDRDRLLADAHRVFSVLGVDVGHAVFLCEGGRFVFSSVSLATPPSCSRVHIRTLAAALAQKLKPATIVGPSRQARL